MSRVRTYPVAEMYTTIQGEATFTGTPAWFIRLQGCPVGCPWCDSRPTWALMPEDQQAVLIPGARLAEQKAGDTRMPWTALSAAQLCAIALAEKGIGHVVITGGEPCVYDLQPLVDQLIQTGYSVQIETSATHSVPVGAWITASPKVDMPGGYRVIPNVVREAQEIKYPVKGESDIERLRELLTLWWIPPDKPIYLQPLSQSTRATRLCIEACLRYGYKLSVQTHKYLEID